MSRSQDTVIDDDEETCPLCIEEFDLSDKNFKPCPCGYQICQFCFNSLKTTYEKSTCPNCRRPYDDATIQYKIPTAEEFKLDQMNKNKKQAAAKRKETEKREVETSARRNLAGVRVKQQNLVYVIGLEPTKKDESMLLETLRGKDYFGQYGEIEKIVVSKAKAGATNQGIGVYVTFRRKEDAATCIEAVDGSQNGERILRAQYGTTKYCSAFLRGETCMNKNCSFLHETGEDAYHTSLQSESSENRQNTRTPLYTQTSSISRTGTTPQPGAVSQSMVRQSSIDTIDSRKGSNDISALPATAGWANANAPTARVRRASQVASTPSPQLTHALPSIKSDQTKPADTTSAPQLTTATSFRTTQPISKPSTTPDPVVETSIESQILLPSKESAFDRIRRQVTTDFIGFIYDDSWMTPEERARIADMPPLYDPYGGAKRRLMEDKEAAERARMDSEAKAKLEAQAKSAAEDALDDEQMAAGSLALGGEPEDNPRSTSARGTIGRPNQTGSAFGEQFLNTRSLTPQQRQQLALLNASGVQQAPGLSQPPAQNTAFEMSDFDRRGPQYSQAQYDQINNHQRHGSRYFNNDSKATNSNRFQGQQQQPFYSSGVQGPPPGLPTAGTPPVSGGGMFAHGQGFTNTGFGAAKDANADLHLRGRSGTNTGHDMSKRGGVEHLADPSILQARIHQGGASGQGLFGGNQVDTSDFPPLPTRSEMRPGPHSRVSSLQSHHGPGLRALTPKVPPGFENSHSHPTTLPQEPVSGRASPARNFTAPVLPAVPSLAQPAASLQPRSSPPKTTQEPSQKLLKSGMKKPNEDGKPSLGSPEAQVPERPPEHGVLHIERSTQDAHTIAEPKAESVYAESKAITQRPTKFDIPAAIATNAKAIGATASNSSRIETPVLDSAVVATPEGIPSRPASPGTAMSEVSKTSMTRPRTLRLTTSMIQQAEAARIASPTVTEKSATLPALSQARREHSRQPSLSSISRSRPSSPSASDRLMSQDVSRAGSPPPGGIVGSAPSRVKSKAQAKKDRKEKAKKVEADEASTTSQVGASAVEEVGPIIARQKKQKKSKASTSVIEDAHTVIENKSESKLSRQASIELEKTNHNDSPLEKDFMDEKSEPERRPASPLKATATADVNHPASRYKVRDLYTYASRHPNTPTAVQAILSSHVSPMTKLLNEMVASGDLAKDHPWLSNPSFNSPAYKLPPDSRRGQEYLDANGYTSNNAFGYLYIDQKDKKELRNGGFVRDFSSSDRPDDLLNSFLLTSRGWVMRHLNADEAERVQELEYKRFLYEKQFGEFGSMTGLGVLEQDDFINLGGGLNELIHSGPRHGVHWVMDENEADQHNDLADEPDVIPYERMESDELIDFAADDIDDETDDDIGPGLIDSDASIPGTWDPNFNSIAGEAGLGSLPTNTAASIHGLKLHNVNLRVMDAESLNKRIHEKHREVDSARKEMEKAEKLLTRKNKEFSRWRDALLKT